jgi:hypothetical protein
MIGDSAARPTYIRTVSIFLLASLPALARRRDNPKSRTSPIADDLLGCERLSRLIAIRH